jgi:integrase
MVPDDLLVPTYTVVSRHSEDCPHRQHSDDCPPNCEEHGQKYISCKCKKHIAIYDPTEKNPIKRQTTKSARTRDWRVAEQVAQGCRDQHDPDKVARAKAEAELKAEREKAEKKATSAVVTIEEAVASFLEYQHNNPNRKHSKRSGKAAAKTMRNYQGLLGTVTQENGTYIVKRPGRLFAWLNTLNPRPLYISDLTSILVDKFRASWNAAAPGLKQSMQPLNDLTSSKSFTRLNKFFEYCKTRGEWISRNPLDGVPAPSVEDGYRTAPFTPEQYDDIVAAIERRYPIELNPEKQTFEEKKQYADARRVLAIVELMRWGGLALADAVQFDLHSIKNGGGHVEYQRVKTNTKAEPTLATRVVTMLREVVPIDADPNRPFYDKDIKPESNRGNWSNWIKATFAEAGIASVETGLSGDRGDREPHAHMLRDTFAVGQMRIQKKLGIVDIDSIAKAMGDSADTVRKHYAPWVKELEDAHREIQQRIVDAQEQEEADKDKQPQQPKVVNFGGRK